MRDAVLSSAAAAVIGALAWSGPGWAIPLSLLLPAVWSQATTRWSAALAVFSYQLAATHGAPTGIVRYYGSVLAVGAALWLLAAAVVALPWAVLWRSSRPQRLAGIPVALLATAVPPIGVVGWVHPLTSAGLVFPNTGWFGVAASLVAMVLLAGISQQRVLLLGAGICLTSIAALQTEPAIVPPGWEGIDTHWNVASPEPSLLRDYNRQLDLLSSTQTRPGRVLLYPESAGGLWTRASERLWTDSGTIRPDQTVLLGAEVPAGGQQTANTLVAVHSDRSEVVYRQRMPVPLSMWRPWSKRGTRAYWFENPVVQVGGIRAAVFICHEQVLVWPVLHSMARKPEIIIACANVWWCSDTTIPAIERNTIEAWARLFSLPCIVAMNR